MCLASDDKTSAIWTGITQADIAICDRLLKRRFYRVSEPELDLISYKTPAADANVVNVLFF
jgi:hypothetical protein